MIKDGNNNSNKNQEKLSCSNIFFLQRMTDTVICNPIIDESSPDESQLLLAHFSSSIFYQWLKVIDGLQT